MPTWNRTYWDSLKTRFESATNNLEDNLDKIVDGRVTPALEDITIGSGRKMTAASLFFDIRDFTNRVESPDDLTLKKTLFTLNCVIPMVMQVIFDHGGYVEKNTGDGVMAIIGAEKEEKDIANDALDTATAIFYALDSIVNPFLIANGISRVDARIGIDMGAVLISRVGLPTGSSKIRRNFLTVVGPSANLASKIQGMAGTNQIWTGDLINIYARENRKRFFVLKTPPRWTWRHHTDHNSTYDIWCYHAVKKDPV